MTERWWDKKDPEPADEKPTEPHTAPRTEGVEFLPPRGGEIMDLDPGEYLGEKLVLKPDRNGCFYVKGSIGNLKNINFLVDTGASYCSVSEKDAKILGLVYGEPIQTSTAAGPGLGYSTTLPDVTIGTMTMRGVEALINPLAKQRNYSVLGMTFLNQIDWEHEDGMLILNPDGIHLGTKAGSGNWLFEDPGYAIAAILLVMGIIGTSFMAVTTGGTKDQWVETEAEVLEKYPGFDWNEIKDCYEDAWGDEYCDYYYELDCWADLDVSYLVDNSSYTGEVDHFPIRTYEDVDGVEDECMDYAENGTMPIGSLVTLYYNTEDPSDVRIEPPWDQMLGLLCCGIIQIILLVMVLLGAWFDVGTTSVTFGGTSAGFGGGSHYGRSSYYGHPDYYDRPWHRRPWFHQRRRHYRDRRGHREAKTSRTVGSSGGRKGGGRSGGGGR